MAVQIQIRRGTAAQWTSANPVLAIGELGVETDTNQLKIGNGTAVWSALPYGGIAGPTGPTGAIGPSTGYGFNFVTTTTDADPGAGNFRFNSAVAASVTQLFIDNNDTLNINRTSWFNTFDDSTSTLKGQLVINYSNGSIATWSVTGAVTAASGYYKIPVAIISGSPPLIGLGANIMFVRTGDRGTNFSDVGFNRQTANYTLTLADVNQVVEMNVAASNTLTVPPESSVAFPIGTTIGGAQYGAGQTTLVAGSGVTLRSRGGALKSAGQYARWQVEKVAADEWYVSGDLVT